jgi:lysophospholipase L1-like esterase
MTESPLPFRRRLLYLCVPYLALVVAASLVELGIRATRPHVDPLEWLVAAPEQRAQIDDRREVRIYEADPLLFWRLQAGLDRVIWDLTLVSTNPQHLRYPRPVGPKAPGTFRIVCLGDSVTFGYRVPRVLPRTPDDYDRSWLPYPALLEAQLRAANPGRTIEVLPLAVPGYSSHQGRAWLARDIEALAPDVVTACFGWNDISRRARSDREAMASSTASVVARQALAHSQAVIHFGMWLRARHTAPAPPTPGPRVMRVDREDYVANLLEIAAVAKAHQATPVFIGPVYRDRVSHPPEGDDIAGHRAALKAVAEREAIAYLEVPELTEDASPGNRWLFEEHIHPNHQGHKLLAERLLAFLAERHVLGDLRVEVAGPGMGAQALPQGR